MRRENACNGKKELTKQDRRRRVTRGKTDAFINT